MTTGHPHSHHPWKTPLQSDQGILRPQTLPHPAPPATTVDPEGTGESSPAAPPSAVFTSSPGASGKVLWLRVNICPVSSSLWGHTKALVPLHLVLSVPRNPDSSPGRAIPDARGSLPEEPANPLSAGEDGALPKVLLLYFATIRWPECDNSVSGHLRKGKRRASLSAGASRDRDDHFCFTFFFFFFFLLHFQKSIL